MSERISDQMLRDLIAAATPGRRVQFHPFYCPEAKGAPWSEWDTSHDMSVILTNGERYKLATYRHANDAALSQVAPQLAAEVLQLREEVARRQWQAMDSAPKDGKNCILAVQSGPFVYAVQGMFHQGEWHNAANIKAEPLCWMPNALIPDEFLPWTEAFNARAALTGGHSNG